MYESPWFTEIDVIKYVTTGWWSLTNLCPECLDVLYMEKLFKSWHEHTIKECIHEPVCE